MTLEDYILELRNFLETIDSNLSICENFFEIKQQINIILQNLINLDNVQTNKIVFLGRQDSRKTEIITNLRKYLPSVCVIKYKSDKYALDNRGYEDESGDFETNKKFMDPPFYNYSDELDNEILNNWCDANIFVVVTNAIGSIGDLDKNFLKKFSNNVFIIKLIFIFTGMEKVSENKRYQLTQHKTNATEIANEILSVPQENIPIFFTYNDQLDTDKFLSKCTFKISLKMVNMFFNCVYDCHEESKEIIKDIRKQIQLKKSYEDKIQQGEQNAIDYIHNMDVDIKEIIFDLLKYGNEENFTRKHCIFSNLVKYWPGCTDVTNVDSVKNSDVELHSMVSFILDYYTNKQFESTKQISQNIRDNIEKIVQEVNHIYKMNFHKYYNPHLLISKCKNLISLLQPTENILLIKEILCFFMSIKLILILKCIDQTKKHYNLIAIFYRIRCKESQFFKNIQFLMYTFLEIKDFTEILKDIINKTEEKESELIIVEDENNILFNVTPNLIKMVNRVQNLVKKHVDLFD